MKANVPAVWVVPPYNLLVSNIYKGHISLLQSQQTI